ncbi:MAG: tetratricopeptide repeat protein [Gemmatimonadota bacterium]
MPRQTDGRSDPRYLFRFGVTAFLLIAGTLVLVLYVLPERYVLNSGFRESGMSFPTPATPFVPGPVVRMAARPLPAPPVPTPPAIIAPGPAEVFWDELTPLLQAERYEEAIGVFEDYLRDYPGDRDARHEYTVMLLTLGRSEEAVSQLRRLLDEEEDFDSHLLLARTLREMDRMDEAAVEYRALTRARPDDVDLWLEWAQGHEWIEEYDRAAAVLGEALEIHPDSVPLRVELARVEFSRDGLEQAAALLADLDDRELAEADALSLRDDIVAALTVPELDEPEPTLLDRARQAREADDFELAAALFEDALREDPDSPETWQAYADFLQYERNDLDGTRNALLEVERLAPDDVRVQYRLAQIEIWTGRNAEARGRLAALLGAVEADPEGAAPVTAADIETALGDLERWNGDRVAAARHYERALEDDPGHLIALDGMAALRAEVGRTLVEVEEPRVGAASYATADTDDFARLDVGGEWVEVEDDWRWGGSAGNRWLDGRTLNGLPAEVQQGVYVDLEAARWWRWATVRTAALFGAQRVLGEWELSAGAAFTHRASDGSQTDVRYEHGPAYPLTATLQSAVAGVVQDHVSVSHARHLDDRWTMTATADGAWLRADLDSIPGAANGSTTRLQGVLSFGRRLTDDVTLGLSARALGFASAGPVVTDSITSVDHRLFWDPRMAISTGPFARVSHDLSSTWSMTGSLGPGIAFIDERTAPGWDVVPHVSAEAGLRREGERFWTSLDFFFYQGQFDGYRMYGARLSVSARDWSRIGGIR